MMMMVIVLGWKISKSTVVVLEEGGVCNQGEGVVDVDLEEGVAEVDMGLSVKQCVEWDGRDTSGITQDQHILNGPWQRKESNALKYLCCTLQFSFIEMKAFFIYIMFFCNSTL